MNSRNLLSHPVDKINRAIGADITSSDHYSRISEVARTNKK